jgi:hypothetical protein
MRHGAMAERGKCLCDGRKAAWDAKNIFHGDKKTKWAPIGQWIAVGSAAIAQIGHPAAAE